MNIKLVRVLFVIAGIYDGVLGLAFFFMPKNIFAWYAVEPPNHVGYVQFPALLLILFAAMFIRIASDPVKNRELIPYGCGLKVAYCGMVFYYQVTSGIPEMWIPFAWADLAFLVLFVLAWTSTGTLVKR